MYIARFCDPSGFVNGVDSMGPRCAGTSAGLKPRCALANVIVEAICIAMMINVSVINAIDLNEQLYPTTVEINNRYSGPRKTIDSSTKDEEKENIIN